MKTVISSTEAEYRRYKVLAESAIDQISDADLATPGPNAIATICWHIGGNLRSRFTDFLTSDGEKSWRKRDTEFYERDISRQEILAQWEQGWSTLFTTLTELSDDDLTKTITIRGTELLVIEALHRSLAHITYHVGQIVYAARLIRGNDWQFLSIPPGGTEAYNKKPTSEKANAHADRLSASRDDAADE